MLSFYACSTDASPAVYFVIGYNSCITSSFISLKEGHQHTCAPIPIVFDEVYAIDSNGFWDTSYLWAFSKTQLSVVFIDFTTSSKSWPKNVAVSLSEQFINWNSQWSNQSMVQNLVSMVVSEKQIMRDEFLFARVVADPKNIIQFYLGIRRESDAIL